MRKDLAGNQVQTFRLFGLALFTSAIMAGCGGGGGGDVNLNANTTTTINDNSTTTGGSSSTNPCAKYVDPETGVTEQGSFDGNNCTYSPDFVDDTNPLMVNLTVPFISGVHIFEGTLQVGEFVDGSDPSQSIPQEGEGPTLTIRAGNRIAFTDPGDYLLINRGSKIIAEGSKVAPITFTGFSDAVLGTASEDESQLWGGIVINGNGITNKCSDQQRVDGTCNVKSEGKDSYFGGNNNEESSGYLKYVVVKHPGYEVAPGDELNGISWNAVGSGTTVQNVQVYATYDDGMEFFGGAVQVENYVALYAWDDSIDWTDGWVGGVTNALVIQNPIKADRCIEADTQDPNYTAVPASDPTIAHLTCIPSGAKVATGSIHGDSMGAEFRRGTKFHLLDSIFYTGYAQDALGASPGRCLRVTNLETAQWAQSGDSSVNSTLLACKTLTTDGTDWGTVFTNGDHVDNWVLNNGTGSYPQNTDNVLLSVADGDDSAGTLKILDGFYTATNQQDAAGNPIVVTPQSGAYIGAVSASDDWTEGWTFGLDNIWF